MIIMSRQGQPASTVPRQDDDAPLHLADGSVVRIGLVDRSARALIEQAMRRLSADSSARRFFAPRFRLSDAELDALTAPAGPDRVAVGAAARRPDGRVEGVGLARYVRMRERPDTAEAAVTVIDAYQGRGIGPRLLRRLAAEAASRGIRRLAGVVLADNAPLLRLLERNGWPVVRQPEGPHLRVEVPLAP